MIALLVISNLLAAFAGAFLGGLYWDDHARTHFMLRRMMREHRAKGHRCELLCNRCGKKYKT